MRVLCVFMCVPMACRSFQAQDLTRAKSLTTRPLGTPESYSFYFTLKFFYYRWSRRSRHGSVLTNLASIHENGVCSLDSLRGLRILRCHELWCSSQTWLRFWLLWLWCRPPATAPIQPLAWELPYALGVALKR